LKNTFSIILKVQSAFIIFLLDLHSSIPQIKLLQIICRNE